MSIKLNPSEKPDRLASISFVARWPGVETETWWRERKPYTFRFPEGKPEVDHVCYFWIIHSKPNPTFPKGKTISVRVYTQFTLPHDFVQPSADEINEALEKIKVAEGFEKWGCDEFEEKKNRTLKTLLSDMELTQYPKRKEEAMQKFHLDPEKVNAVFFTITVNGEPVKTKDNIVFLPNDELKQVDEKRVERYLAQKYADNQFDADVQFQVVAHHERAEQPDKDTLLIETLQKLAK